MGTTTDKLQAILNSKADIRSAIIEKGVAVPEDTVLADYDDKIREIPDIREEAYFIKSDTWDHVELPPELKISGLTFNTFATQGYLLISTRQSTGPHGIWKFDKTSKTFTHISIDFGYDWGIFFESSIGEIFVSSASSNVTDSLGIWKLDLVSNSVVRVYNQGYSWNTWFESSSGDIFVSSNNSSTASYSILKLNDNRSGFTVARGNGIDYNWSFWFESSLGEIFVSSNSTVLNTGIIKYDRNTNSFVQYYNLGFGYQHWFEDSQQRIFTSHNGVAVAGLGILRLNSARTAFTQIYTQTHNWRYWFEIDNRVYVSSSNSTAPLGILVLILTGDGFSTAYSSGYNWNTKFVTSQGETLIGGINGPGVLRHNGGQNFGRIGSTTSVGMTVFIENSNGDLIVGGVNELKMLNSSRTEFESLFSSVGTYYNHIFDKYIISTHSSNTFPIVDYESVTQTEFLISSRQLISNWIINYDKFIKFTGSYPMELYPVPKYASSFKYLGDREGSVFIIPSNISTFSQIIIFNTKPL